MLYCYSTTVTPVSDMSVLITFRRLLCYWQLILEKASLFAFPDMTTDVELDCTSSSSSLYFAKNKNIIFNNTIEIQLAGRQKNIKFMKLALMLYTILLNYKHTYMYLRLNKKSTYSLWLQTTTKHWAGITQTHGRTKPQYYKIDSDADNGTHWYLLLRFY